MKYDLLKKQYYIDKSGDKAQFEKYYHERFENGVKLDFAVNGYQAFYVEDINIFKTIIKIQRTHEKIAALAHRLPPIALGQYAQRCLIDEIILTNDIEGVYSTRKEIGSVLADLEKHDHKNRFFGLVNKYKMLNEQQSIDLKCSKDIRALYDELFYQEILVEDPNDLPDGEIFRKSIVKVTDATQRVFHEGLMPEEAIIEAMDKALNILNEDEMDIIIRTALFHYMFGYIHPFYEGNGRMSRFISSYMLTQEFHPLTGYKLSYVIKEDLSHYYRAFRDCNEKLNRGDLTPFILMFVDVLNKMCDEIYEDLSQRYDDLTALSSLLQNITDDIHMRDLYYVLLQAALFSEGGIATNELLNLSKVSRPTLNKRLQTIEEKGLLITQTLGNKGKYYQLDLNKLK